MQIERTRHFRRSYRALPEQDKQRAKRTIALLTQDWRHPGPHVKRVQSTDDISEARVSLSLRITFQLVGDTIILRNVGPHNHTLRNA